MQQLLLWINLITFAALVSGIGPGYLMYRKTGKALFRSYLLYLSSYALWLLFSTYVFFQAAFMQVETPVLMTVFAYFRAALSVFMIYVGELFYLRAAGKIPDIGIRPWLFAVPAAVFLAVSVYLMTGARWLNSILGTAYNLVFFVYAVIALSNVRGSRTGREARLTLPFLWFSVLFYGVLVPANILVPLFLPSGFSLIVNVAFTGAFGLGWGFSTFFMFTKVAGKGAPGAASGLPLDFLNTYAITGREGEILSLLIQGTTNKRMADSLFISQRTVDTHVYNIFRKCDVKNRVELAALIKRFERTT